MHIPTKIELHVVNTKQDIEHVYRVEPEARVSCLTLSPPSLVIAQVSWAYQVSQSQYGSELAEDGIR